MRGGKTEPRAEPISGGAAVGVDVGGTKLLTVVVHADGHVTSEQARSSPKGGADLVAAVVDSATRLSHGAPAAVGVGAPALVDGAGVVRFSPHLPGLVGTELTAGLRSALPGARLWVGNDATAACWAEHDRGAAAGADNAVMVTLGTGIGGAAIAGGRLVDGANRYAGEFGHMVVDPRGPQCPCGRRGCWERYASGWGLGVLGREMAVAGRAPRLVELAGGDPEAVRGEHVTAAAAEGDPAAAGTVAQFAWWLALGLANLAAAFDPEVIVVGGGLVAAGEALMEPARRAFSDLVEAPAARPDLRIEAAVLGDKAGAIGAGLLASGAVGTAAI